MFSRLTSVFRRSSDNMEDSLKEDVADPITSKPNVTNDTFDRMDPSEEEDVEPEDGVILDLIRHPEPYENEQSISEHSSSLSEDSEIDSDSEGSCLIQIQPQATSTSTLWSQINMKSVAVQCDPIEMKSQCLQCKPDMLVTQGVQCEPILQVTRGVQCEPVLVISQSVQYEPEPQIMQCVQCDMILRTSQAVQYESPVLSSSKETQCEHTSLSPVANISACVSTDLNNELIQKSNHLQNEGDYRQSTSDLSFPLPPLQKELDSVNFVSSSQTSFCMSSSDSTQSLVNDKVVSQLHGEPSQGCDSTRSVSEGSVESINRTESSCKTIMERRNKMKKKDTNKIECLMVKEKNEKGTATTSKHKEKRDEDYTAEELLEEMATWEEFTVNNKESNESKCNKNGSRETKKKCQEIHETVPAVKRAGKRKVQSTFNRNLGLFCLKMVHDGVSPSKNSVDNNNGSELCYKNITKRKSRMKSKDTNERKLLTVREENEEIISPSKQKKKRDEDYAAEELLKEMAACQEFSVNNEESSKSKCDKNEDRGIKETGQVHVQDLRVSSPALNITPRNSSSMEPPEIEHSQQIVTQWFNSMACERASSPESLGDDTLEELRGSRSHYFDKLYSAPKRKGSKCLNDDNSSNHQIREDNSKHLDSVKKSDGKSLPHDPEISEQASSAKKKVSSDVNNSKTLPKSDNLLVPYSESESEGCNDSSSPDLNGSRAKPQDHNKQQNSSLTKKQCLRDPEQESLAQSVSNENMKRNIGAKRTIELVKYNPTSIRDIWDSDDGSDDDLDCSRASTVTYRTTATYKSRTSSKSSHWKRPPYTKEEREAILWYIIDHKYFKLIKGRAMWERMEKADICPNRTWQSMKEHFIKKILPNLQDFHLDSVTL